jgi:hypothetical protein
MYCLTFSDSSTVLTLIGWGSHWTRYDIYFGRAGTKGDFPEAEVVVLVKP